MLINIPLALLSILVIIMAAAPFFVSLLPLIRSGQGETQGQLIDLAISGLFGSILLICFTILCIAAVAIVIRPFYEFFVRAGVIRRRGGFGRERGRRHPVWHTHADHSGLYRRPVSGVRVDRLDGGVSGCDGTTDAGRPRTGWPRAVTFFLLPRR